MATNSAIGIVTATTLSVVVRPEYAAHTARHTMRLHRIPSTNASPKPWCSLVFAVSSTTAPQAPFALCQVPPA